MFNRSWLAQTMTKVEIDFGKTAADYAGHRAGFPRAFFERLSERGVGRAGQRALDLGSGTGTIARGMARLGSLVTALDISRALLQQGALIDADSGVMVRRAIGRAEAAPLAPASFDVVAAGQCWHWFDRAVAAREALRLLAPGGRLVIAHFDWVPLDGNVVAATERLILKHNPAWSMDGGTGLYPAWLGDVAGAGFEDIETFSFDIAQPYTHVAWRGRIRASAGVAASLSPEQVAAFDGDLARLLRTDYPDDPLLVPHRVWALLCRAPARR